jgi:P27 family predicted phage terminase small subunit
MPGPPPTPTPILNARGSWRAKAREKSGEPKLPVETPSCPSWLSKEAKAEWRRQVAALVRMGVLAKADRAALAVFCEAWSEFQQASETIGRSGLLLKDPETGALKRNPLLKVRNDAADRVVQLAGQFGFTPAARTRLRATQEDKKDDPQGKARFFAGAAASRN